MKRVLFVLFCLQWSSFGFARNYFVAAAGDDRGDGSRAHPWRSIAAVNRLGFAAGDSVFFRGGDVFLGSLRMNGVQEVYFGYYGHGRPKIVSGDSAGILLYRCAEVRGRGF